MELFGYSSLNGEAGLDRLLPALIEALAPVAASVHTLKLSHCRQQLGAAMSASLVRTLPSLLEFHISRCHLHDSMVAHLAQLQLLRLLRLFYLKAPLCADESDWGLLASGLAALLADRGQVQEGGGGEGRLRLEWVEQMARSDSPDGHLAYVNQVRRLQAVVQAVSAAGQAALFTHNLEQLRSAVNPEIL